MRTKTNQSAQDFLNVEAIENNILWSRDKMLYAYIKVRGQDNSLLDESDNITVTDRLTVALSKQTQIFQILSIPRTVDTGGMIAELQELRSSTRNDARLRLIGGEIAALESLAAEGAKEPLIVIKIWQGAAPNADRALLERASSLAAALSDNQIFASVMDDSEILHLCMIYAELGVWQEQEASPAGADIPYLTGRKRIFSRKKQEDPAHAQLMEQITPVGGLMFYPDWLMVGNAYCRCYGAITYPANVDYNWAAGLTNATDCITCITYYPGRSSEIGDALSRAVTDNTRGAESERNVRERKRLERTANDAGDLIDDLDAKSKALGHMSIVAMPFASSKEKLDEAAENVLNRYAGLHIKLKVLANLQSDVFRHLSPYHPNQAIVDSIVMRILPLETLIGGYPCSMNTLRDDHGAYFARTADHGVVSLDIRTRGKDRTNGNGIVSGIPGTGKSTFLKHLMQSVFMQGFRVVIIDPEREFRDLCKALDGSWLDASGGKVKINLFQVQEPIPDDEDDTKYTSNTPPVVQHISYVMNFLRYLIPSLTDLQVSLLNRALRELYEAFDLPLESEYDPDRPPESYPIMEDYYRLLLEKAKQDPRYDDLALLLEDMAIGASSYIWNGHTNIDLSADMIVYDTKNLSMGSERNQAAQYSAMIRMILSMATSNPQQPFILFCDEAQNVLDPSFPQAAKDLKNLALRLRKYEGYLWLCFHSIQELLDERIRLWGQPILDAAAYKILFGTDGRNLADTVQLYHLTASEQRVLEARRRGQALALIGSHRLKVQFEIPDYKLELMGRAGGR